MKILTKSLLVGFLGTATFILPATAQTTRPAKTPTSKPAEDPAQFAKSAGKRAAGIIDGLSIPDVAKAARAQTILTEFLVAIHQWHVTNDDHIKELSKDTTGADELEKIQAERHAIHDAAMKKLSAELTPDQMVSVKEKLTGGQIQATIKAYPEIVPNLTAEDKAMILKTLIAAREDAMDSGSSNERKATIKRYKGTINNYLDAHGHNVKQAYADWGAAQKLKQGGAATKPADEAADPN